MSINYILWKRFILVGGGIVGSGVALYTFTTPTEEQLIAKLSPELKANYLKNRDLRRREQEELIKLVKKTSASNDPIWYTGDLATPWVKNGNGKALLIAKEEFDKEQAAEKQKAELAANKLMLQELELKKQEQEKKAKKWFW